jgi:acyl carrier protein
LNRERITSIVLSALEMANLGRAGQTLLEVSPTAPLFGAPSPLDSLGLVALLIDIEEAFQQEGHSILLSDERAMSQSRSPFRDVPSLVGYIERLVGEQQTS